LPLVVGRLGVGLDTLLGMLGLEGAELARLPPDGRL
jgi:hypothetical protein